jgi:hypothetical protein
MTYGPVDLLALELQTDRLKGEIVPELLELVRNKIVRLIDLVVIRKDEDGHHEAFEMEQLAPDLLAVFDPLEVGISGMVQIEDIEMIASEMKANTTAAVLLVENLWAVKFAEAVLRANGRVMLHDRIPFEVVNQTLETFAQAESSQG